MWIYFYLGIFYTYYFFLVQMTPPSAYMNVGMCIHSHTCIHTFVCLYILWYCQFSTIIWTFHCKSLSWQLNFSEFFYSLRHILPVVKLCLYDKQDTFTFNSFNHKSNKYPFNFPRTFIVVSKCVYTKKNITYCKKLAYWNISIYIFF